MEFNFVKTIVSSFVFISLLFIIVNHIIKIWFSGNLNESDRNAIENFETDMPNATPSVGPSSTPSVGPSSMPSMPSMPSSTSSMAPYSTSSVDNSESIANLFDRVNTQMDMIRTLKEPYTDAIQPVNYNRDLSGNMLILMNLKSLVNTGIAVNDKDLQTNPGITKVFQYGGNDSIADIISDMATMDETKIAELCKKKDAGECDKISSTTDRASCVLKIQKQCLKEIEASFIARTTAVVDAHQRIIDRILQKESVA